VIVMLGTAFRGNRAGAHGMPSGGGILAPGDAENSNVSDAM
jgi:hypothetical protein